ncbi:uncharacterized protein [Haliotis asinina]|uniref:uncharacterized protein n=1 Tax=Haliotis asinina TaxID=109174 RepID=UPI0035322466
MVVQWLVPRPLCPQQSLPDYRVTRGEPPPRGGCWVTPRARRHPRSGPGGVFGPPTRLPRKAWHIPGAKDILAEDLSRPYSPPSMEWQLHPRAFQMLCLQLGVPLVNLFATKLNHALQSGARTDTSPKGSSPESAKRTDTRGPSGTQSARLASKQRSLRRSGYSNGVASVIASSQRVTTGKLYDFQWEAFVSFCEGHRFWAMQIYTDRTCTLRRGRRRLSLPHSQLSTREIDKRALGVYLRVDRSLQSCSPPSTCENQPIYNQGGIGYLGIPQQYCSNRHPRRVFLEVKVCLCHHYLRELSNEDLVGVSRLGLQVFAQQRTSGSLFIRRRNTLRPTHIEISGNTMADLAAKAALNKSGTPLPIPYPDYKATIRMYIRDLMQKKWDTQRESEDYLVAVANKVEYAYIRYTSGETGGLVEIQYPHHDYRRVDPLGSFSFGSHTVSDKMKITSDVENAAIIVSGSDENISIVVEADGIFSPLPISTLGTKYILPSSLAPNSSYQSLLLIATHNMSATVDIFFRMNRESVHFFDNYYSDGDKLSLKLNPYQTLRITTPHDLNGTVIISDHNIAVYSGVEYASEYIVYDQLLRIKHYGLEYVVAVNDTKLELQIISEHSNVQITFSSGPTVSTGERRLYNRSLERGASLHFTATHSVLVILSRADGYNSAFTTVSPVYLYVTHRGVWLYPNNFLTTLRILTYKKATVLIKHKRLEGRLRWIDIAGSSYKIGTLIQWQRYTWVTSISSDLPFTVLSFYNGSVYNSGYKVSVDETVHYTGQTYLMTLVRYSRDREVDPYILASAGETRGQWQVQDPHSGRVWSRRFNPYSTDYFYISTTTTVVVLVHVRHAALQIKGVMGDRTSFSPLPVSALGTKYIMSSCLPTDGGIEQDTTAYISVLMIATHSKKADIDVIFRLDGNVIYAGRTYVDGDTLSVRLDRYQTSFLNSSSDMTRTIVTATGTIAVYSGTYHVRDTVFTTFEQLLPVKHYGHEYIVAIQDPYYCQRAYGIAMSYQLQVINDHSDTHVTFDNGSSISVGEDGVYRKQCGNNETFYFNTTRPVMATLCVIGGDYTYSALIIVPPVNLYSTITTQKATGVMYILTDQEHVAAQQPHYNTSTVFSLPVTWRNVSSTRFKVGTFTSDRYTITVRSNSTFGLLGYNDLTICNGGYSLSTYTDTESQTTSTDSQQHDSPSASQCAPTPEPSGTTKPTNDVPNPHKKKHHRKIKTKIATPTETPVDLHNFFDPLEMDITPSCERPGSTNYSSRSRERSPIDPP